MFQSKKQKITSHIVFCVYFALLVWLVVFKFATSPSQLPSIQSINLIPYYYAFNTIAHLKQVIYNIIVFVPLGVYIQIFKNEWKIITKCAAVFLTSFLFEAVQYIFAIGVSDITDIIDNTAGGIIGIIIFVIIRKIAPKKYISIFNTLGILVEITAIGMLALLLIANG
ncbi:MAG: VanZ family protein [Clostridia bacterium]|nr:VanZ family protein [Clostridia bacterium]MBO5358490.1 VanZ family protein [Clostridia bacterium]